MTPPHTMPRHWSLGAIALGCTALFALGETAPLAAQSAPAAPAVVRLTPQQMLAMARQTLSGDDRDGARRLLEALLADRDIRVRNEARFLLAGLAAEQGNLAQAGTLLRAILDEEPGALRVRLELARLLERIGDVNGARRELRLASAGGLPPEVARVVDRYSAALRERKPLGAQARIALAPDTNINRATRSDTLDTVIGEFVLDEAAKAQSGIGLALGGEAYWRVPLGSSSRLLSQLAVDGAFYRESRFNDMSARLSMGPELNLGPHRVQVLGSAHRRWFGGRIYSRALGLTATLEKPLGPTAQLRISGELSWTAIRANRLQDTTSLHLSGTYERALSERSGLSVGLAGGRHDARDDGYSTWFGQLAVHAWGDFGPVTLIGGAAYSRLEADSRLALYPERRREDQLRLSAAAAFRQLTIAGFAPRLRLGWERTRSTIDIHDYARLSGEIGIVRAF